MKLDRNINPDGQGKYALLLLRKVRAQVQRAGGLPADIENAWKTFNNHGFIDHGWADLGNEFFVIRLKDKYAAPALAAYAGAAMKDDPEWAREVLNLANKAAVHVHQHSPD